MASLSQDEAQTRFGQLAKLVGAGVPALNIKARQRLGWQPTAAGLLQDLARIE